MELQPEWLCRGNLHAYSLNSVFHFIKWAVNLKIPSTMWNFGLLNLVRFYTLFSSTVSFEMHLKCNITNNYFIANPYLQTQGISFYAYVIQVVMPKIPFKNRNGLNIFLNPKRNLNVFCKFRRLFTFTWIAIWLAKRFACLLIFSKVGTATNSHK